MENLIMNSQWAPGMSGGPQFFSGFGPITYDNLSINGYRTCSITMMSPMMVAQDFYDPLIDVKNKKNISWGLTIRTVAATSIALVTVFYDKNMHPINTYENPITDQISYDFKQIVSKFVVPLNAEKVRFSIKFSGITTACTYYKPVAFYS